MSHNRGLKPDDHYLPSNTSQVKRTVPDSTNPQFVGAPLQKDEQNIAACAPTFNKCHKPLRVCTLRIPTKIYYPCCIQWKPCALLVEFLGSAILVFTIALATLIYGSNLTVVSLAAGFILLALIDSFGPYSGGHFNPAVSFMFWLAGKLNIFALFLYWAVQLVGAIIAGLLLLIFFDSASGLGTPLPVAGFSNAQAFIAELIGATVLFHFILFGVKNSCHLGVTAGLGFAALEFIFIPISGGAFNFIRYFGPAVFSGLWYPWWIYLFPSFIAAIITWAIWWLCKKLKCYQKHFLK